MNLQKTVEKIEENDTHPFVRHAMSALGIDPEMFQFEDRLYSLTQIAKYLIDNDMQLAPPKEKLRRRRKSVDLALKGPPLSVPYSPSEHNEYKLGVEKKKLENRPKYSKI